METKYWHMEADAPDMAAIAEAAALIRAGELVVFPTETVYGLGADAGNETAVRAIFAAKGRPGDNPLIVHIAEKEALKQVAAELTPAAEKLIRRFWPGPLTVILPKHPDIAPSVTAGLPTVAVRMPSHPVAAAFIRAAGVPIAAPSANRSGKPSPTIGEHARQDLSGRVAAILDAGCCEIGLESTVVDCTQEPVRLLRPGGITLEELRMVLGEVELAAALLPEEKPLAPGMKYPHYAPAGKVYLAEPAEAIAKAESLRQAGEKVALLLSEETADNIWDVHPDISVLILGSREDLEGVAQTLFESLRSCDQIEASAVVVESFPENGIGLAVMNRLRKAACAK